MPPRHIIAPLTGEPGSEHVALAAMRLGQRLSAHVAVDFADFDPNIYMAELERAPSGYQALYQAAAAVREQLRLNARRFFDRAAVITQMPIAAGPGCKSASAEWGGDGASAWPALGALADLVVLGNPGRAGAPTDWALVEDVLFRLRRPALLLPDRVTDVRFDRPLIAWNGSAEAASATRCALGLFEPEADVVVFQAGLTPSGLSSVESLVDHLDWHGFAAKVERLGDCPRLTGETILNKAKALGASVLVMGAYTHSRARESVLGGVTHFMLKNADLPVLLAH